MVSELRFTGVVAMVAIFERPRPVMNTTKPAALICVLDGANSMRILRLKKGLPLLLKMTSKYIVGKEVCQGHTRNCR